MTIEFISTTKFEGYEIRVGPFKHRLPTKKGKNTVSNDEYEKRRRHASVIHQEFDKLCEVLEYEKEPQQYEHFADENSNTGIRGINFILSTCRREDCIYYTPSFIFKSKDVVKKASIRKYGWKGAWEIVVREYCNVRGVQLHSLLEKIPKMKPLVENARKEVGLYPHNDIWKQLIG